MVVGQPGWANGMGIDTRMLETCDDGLFSKKSKVASCSDQELDQE